MNSEIIEKIARTRTGKDLIKYLEQLEIHYADIRNLQGTPAEVRIDALKIIREALLDKLLVMSGELDPPNNNEYI